MKFKSTFCSISDLYFFKTIKNPHVILGKIILYTFFLFYKRRPIIYLEIGPVCSTLRRTNMNQVK